MKNLLVIIITAFLFSLVNSSVFAAIRLTSITLDPEDADGSTTNASGAWSTNTSDPLSQMGVTHDGVFLNSPGSGFSLGEISINLHPGINTFDLYGNGIFPSNLYYGAVLFFDGVATPPSVAVFNGNGATGTFSIQPAENTIMGGANGGLFFDKAPGTSRYVAPDGSIVNVLEFTVDSNISSADFVSSHNIGANGIPDTVAHLSLRVDAEASTLQRVSRSTMGSEGNNISDEPSISNDGRYVAFSSYASNLVPDDSNTEQDVFVLDSATSQTTRISVASDGVEASGSSNAPSINADGRYVAFTSAAPNLVPGDTNGSWDIFVHDLTTGQTTRVSVASDGTEGNSSAYSPSISADGQYVAFSSDASNLVPGDTNGTGDIFIHDRITGQTIRASIASDGSQANNISTDPSISADGRYVAFSSDASNLESGDTNGVGDIFVHDRTTGQTICESIASDGNKANNSSSYPSISADGRYVAFASDASNLVQGDANGLSDIFVHDRTTGQTTRISIASDGSEANDPSYYPSISADGRYVTFASLGSLVSGDLNGLSDIFVHDRTTGQTTRISVTQDGSEGNGHSSYASISADGRHIAFSSEASNLVQGDTNGERDVFIAKYVPPLANYPPVITLLGDNPMTIVQGSVFTDPGAIANDPEDGDISSKIIVSGRVNTSIVGKTTLTYAVTDSQGLLSTPVVRTVIVISIQTSIERVSVASDGIQGNNYSSLPSVSADGQYVAFVSDASNLVTGDTNERADIFIRDRTTGITIRVSVASDGNQANNASYNPSISADGRYVAFTSYASNLVPGDTNYTSDIFIHDRKFGQTTRVSVSSDGNQMNSASEYPSISTDGRYIAFSSYASNLVPGDTNGTQDVFIHDRTTGQTTRVSVTSSGREANNASYSPAISADGRYVAFTSSASNLALGDTNEMPDIFVHDLTTRETARVSVASDGSEAIDLVYDPALSAGGQYPSISADGRYVTFSSTASNLVLGDTNEQSDIFVHDRVTGQTTRVDVASDGSQADYGSSLSSISADGRYIAFDSYSPNLVPGDTNNGTDIFVHDRATGQTTRVNIASDGNQANNYSLNLALSANGSYVAFTSEASNLVPGDTNGVSDVFVAEYSPPSSNLRPVITLLGNNLIYIEQGSAFIDPGATAIDAEDGDLSRKIEVLGLVNTSIVGKTTLTYLVEDSQGLTSTPVVRTVIVTRMKTFPERVSVSTDGSQGIDGTSYNCSDLNYRPSVNSDGRYVAFLSDSSNLVPGDTNAMPDIFFHDRITDETTRVSVDSDGNQANSRSSYPSISADGRYVVFSSSASNLVQGDTNNEQDIFVHDRTTRLTARVNVASDGSQGGGGQTPTISADGRYVVFSSYASNLVQGDANGKNDIFVHDRATKQTTLLSVDSDGSQANDNSYSPSVSADGRYVAFTSNATNLVLGDTNGLYDIFVHDRTTKQTTRVSVASDGSQATGTYGNSGSASISVDGRYVVFSSNASNLVPGDTNQSSDNFIHDRETRQTTRISVGASGSNPSISADGRFVAFGANAIDVYDRMTGQTTRVSVTSDGSQVNFGSCHPSISADGGYVAFGSDASTLVLGDTNGVWDTFITKYSPASANYRPIITLLGDNPMTLDEGSQFTDPGATAIDQEDGDISSKIHVDIDTSIAWKITLTYTVTDSQGLASTPVVRLVNITPLKGLNIYIFGNGTGAVTSNPPGVSCPSKCSGQFPSGSTVTLTAIPAEGTTFAGWWDPNCGGNSNCTVIMDATYTNVHATFTLKTYSVSGRVADGTTGQPIAGVTVYANGPNMDGVSTTTDANGNYTLSELKHGTSYFLSLYKNGSNYAFSPISRRINLSSSLTGVNFQAGISYFVSGKVVDEYGKPIFRATILADTGERTTTDDTGAFKLFVMAGSRTITVSATGYTFPAFYRVDVSANTTGLVFKGYDKPPIVMVHGGGGGNPSVFAKVPDALVQAGYHVEFARLYTLMEYTPKLDDNIPYLIDAIDRAKAATGQPKVILIAHSMGGLVCRHYIEGPAEVYHNDVSALFTFGSPHSGAVIRDYLSFGTVLGGPGIYDLSEEGTRIFNATHSRHAGVDYHLIGGDAPMDVTVQECVDACPLWPLPGPCWRVGCYDTMEPTYVHHPEVRNSIGYLFGLFFNGQQNDALVSTDSATGLAGWADRASTDEVHGDWYGDHTYFYRESDLSRSYYQCIKKVLVDKTATTCGQWSDKDRVPTTAAAAAGLKVFGASGESSSQNPEGSLPSLEQLTPVATGTLLAQQKKNHTLLIEGGAATFAAYWASGSVAVTLIDPQGQAIDPIFAANHSDIVTYKADNNTAIYYFHNAAAGEWQVLLQGGSDITAEGSNYSAFAAFQNTLSFTSHMDRAWYAPSDTAHITAIFSEALSSANVTATLLYSDGSSNEVTLSLDGQGQYEASIAVPAIPGYTQVRLKASGIKADGSPFARGQDLLFQISPQSAALNGAYSDQPDPQPENPTLYQNLDIRIGITSTLNGRFGLSADLVDAEGKFVAHSMALEELPVGANTFVLRFSGIDIFAAQKNGPYHLTNVMLTDQREATLVVAEAKDVYATGDYDYRKFAERTNFPTVSIGGPYSVKEGDSITLTALGNDPENDPLTFAWDLDDDGTFEISGQNATFSAEGINGPRIYPIKVQVIDSNGFSAIGLTTLDVVNVAPVVHAGSDTTIQPGEIFSGSGSFTDSDIDTWTATVDYGDGTGIQSLTLTDSSFELSHLYDKIGVYPVTVTVSDNDDGKGTGIIKVTVSRMPDDLDGDGFADNFDACPYSNLGTLVVIGNCDTGVRNSVDTNGCTIFDRIGKCAMGIKNHEFISCVSQLTSNLKQEGTITGSEEKTIQNCTAQANNYILSDIDGNGTVECNDLKIVKASFGKKSGQAGFDPRTDINGDGIINVYDLSVVSRQLPTGTKCQ